MASTKYVPKYKRIKEENRDKDEFFLCEKDVKMVKQFKEKIEKLYNIQISFDSNVDDDQWINIFGEREDKRNAKVSITFFRRPNCQRQLSRMCRLFKTA